MSNTIGAMEVFTHHIQEYKKGLRALVLYTTKASNRDAIEKRLKREMIDYYIQKVNGTKINVFFGNSICVAVIKQMNITSLSNLTDEEDFILGTMLGYDRVKQCERYLRRKRNGRNDNNNTGKTSNSNININSNTSIAQLQTETISATG
ncbi:MAG: DUF2023 family protein [Methanophagales archaeon]|nr:DUF2023 family protein [Methanophagales archaeon]